jgi:predicted phosphodiesterase
MRLAIVSDIHGNLPALEAVVADCTRRGVDAVINLGDSLSGPLLPRETAQYLMAQDWVHLAGNHERQILEAQAPRGASDAYARSQLGPAQLEWIAGLGPRLDYADDVLLCHGSPRSDLEYLLETLTPAGLRLARPAELEERLDGSRAALVVCGHSHLPRSLRNPRGQLIVNPGSVGVPGYEANEPYPHVVENGSPDARYAIVERRGAVWRSMLLAVPYDHASMAQLALERGRPDWYRALATGYPTEDRG